MTWTRPASTFPCPISDPAANMRRVTDQTGSLLLKACVGHRLEAAFNELVHRIFKFHSKAAVKNMLESSKRICDCRTSWFSAGMQTTSESRPSISYIIERCDTIIQLAKLLLRPNCSSLDSLPDSSQKIRSSLSLCAERSESGSLR